jgi:hypothetical protein
MDEAAMAPAVYISEHDPRTLLRAPPWVRARNSSEGHNCARNRFLLFFRGLPQTPPRERGPTPNGSRSAHFHTQIDICAPLFSLVLRPSRPTLVRAGPKERPTQFRKGFRAPQTHRMAAGGRYARRLRTPTTHEANSAREWTLSLRNTDATWLATVRSDTPRSRAT